MGVMKKFITACLLLVYLTGCKRELSDQFIPYENDELNNTDWVSSVNTNAAVYQLHKIFYLQPVIDSFYNAAGGTITLQDHTTITFPPLACVDNATSSLLSGNIRTEITQLKRKGDFIRYDRPTSYNDLLLENGQAYNVDLYQGSKEASLALNTSYNIKYESDIYSGYNMLLFYGGSWVNGSDSLYTWLINYSGAVSSWQTFNPQSSVYLTGYEMQAYKTHWVYCSSVADTNYSNPSRVNVSFPLNFTNANTCVYAVYKNRNIVARLTADLTSKTFYLPKIATGEQITIVSLSKIGNDYYWGAKEVTVQNSDLINVTPQQKNVASIGQSLDAL